MLATIGTGGDVHPFVGVALALRERGHRVTLLASGQFEGLARSENLPFVALSSAAEYQAAVANPGLFGGNRRKRFGLAVEHLVRPAIRPLYDAIAREYVPGETVVVASTLAYGGRIAQLKHGVPLATVHLQPTVLRTVHDMPALPQLPVWLKRAALPLADRIYDRFMSEPVNRVTSEVGLPPARRIVTDWVNSPDRVIGLFPEWYAPPQPDWPSQTRLTGFPLYDAPRTRDASAEALAFIESGDPPVIFTAGTGMAHAHSFFAVSVEVCKRMGRRGMLLASHPEQIPSGLPDTVRHFAYLPFSEVLSRTAALVHHGGIGTMAQAVAAGVPQFVVPVGFDQPDTAARVRRLGIGDSLKPADYQAPAVQQGLTALLSDPGVAARCKEFAGRVSPAAALAETCRLIEEVAVPRSERRDVISSGAR